jgi:signal transduction histidine kinase/ActR/RegA family two-component response regulator
MPLGETEADADDSSFREGGVLEITKGPASARSPSPLRQLAKATRSISDARGVDSVLDALATESRNLIGAHQAISSLTDERFGDPVVRSVSFSENYANAWSGDLRQIDTEAITRIAKSTPLLRLTQPELEAHVAWRGQSTPESRRPSLRGWLSAPLTGRDGGPVGLIHLSDKIEGEFTEDDETLLFQLAQIASIALENARLCQSLRQSEKQKDEFLATLAHELRNPLAAITNAVALIRLSPSGQHVDWGIELIGRQVRGLARLIDELIDVSRLTRGKIELRFELLDVAKVIHQAVQTVQPFIDERRHELTIKKEPGVLRIRADPIRLEQVLVNLLSNAAKFTDPGGKIGLTAETGKDEIVFRVTDNGQGVPAESLVSIFDLFAQGDRNLARSEGGLGIGLTLVKRLVALHGGSVEAHSAGLDKGTEFIVRLPAPREVEGATCDAIKATAKPFSPILIADDNVDLAQGLARLLKIAGHDVRIVHDGPSAVATAREMRPGLCMVDIGLPGMDGYQVARSLRQDPALQGATLIAISGYSQDSDRRRSRESGFDQYLVKPIDLDTLRGVLEDLTGKLSVQVNVEA